MERKASRNKSEFALLLARNLHLESCAFVVVWGLCWIRRASRVTTASCQIFISVPICLPLFYKVEHALCSCSCSCPCSCPYFIPFRLPTVVLYCSLRPALVPLPSTHNGGQWTPPSLSSFHFQCVSPAYSFFLNLEIDQQDKSSHGLDSTLVIHHGAHKIKGWYFNPDAVIG